MVRVHSKRMSPSQTIGSLNNNGKYLKEFKISGMITCDAPNIELYKFHGKGDIKFKNGSKMEISYNQKNIILKGSKLMNTEWVIGFIVYAGHDTKIVKNTNDSKVKISKIESLVNNIVLGIMVFQILLCASSAILNIKYFDSNVQNNQFLPSIKYSKNADAAINYFTYLMLLNTMIPISLIITLEMVKIIQGYFMSVNVELYSKSKRILPKIGSVSINEELGQVTHIFTDKTGTLTKNKMVFKFCVIGNNAYQITSSSNENDNLNQKSDKQDKIQNYNKVVLEDNIYVNNDIEDIVDFSPNKINNGNENKKIIFRNQYNNYENNEISVIEEESKSNFIPDLNSQGDKIILKLNENKNKSNLKESSKLSTIKSLENKLNITTRPRVSKSKSDNNLIAQVKEIKSLKELDENNQIIETENELDYDSYLNVPDVPLYFCTNKLTEIIKKFNTDDCLFKPRKIELMKISIIDMMIEC